MNEEELVVRVQEAAKVISFSADDSETGGGNSFDLVTIPLQCQCLFTSYFRLHSGYSMTVKEKRFAAIAWEVLNIVKENFPSKVMLFQENLDLCKPVYLPLSNSEELRRQVSCILTLKEEGRRLTEDELEDLWYTLQAAERQNDQRALGICLETLNILGDGLMNENQCDILLRISERTDTLMSNKRIIQELHQKREAGAGEDVTQVDLNSLESSANTTTQGGLLLIPNRAGGGGGGEGKTSTRMCLFQLTESNDINRVTLILKTLSTKSRESINQMLSKYNLSHKLAQILKKYCNAEYGFDHQASKLGTFQYYLTKLMILLSSDYAVFLEFIQQSQTLDLMTQIVEEAIIYAHDRALQGCQISTVAAGDSDYLQRFLRLSLDFFDLALSKNFAEFLPMVRDNLGKIQGRFVKIIQKKDQNPLLEHFMKNQNNQQPNAQPVTNKLTYDQISSLKELSEGLYSFASELSFKLQRVEGLNDTLFENHEAKYHRLFPVLAQRMAHRQDGREKVEAKVLNYKQQRLTIDSQPTKFESIPTFSGYQDQESQLSDVSREVNNQENINSNQFLKNQIEKGFSKVVNSHQQLNRVRGQELGNHHLMMISNTKSKDVFHIPSSRCNDFQ